MNTTSQPTPETYDVLIIGSGAGGLASAVTAAYHGMSVLVVEKEAVLGGTTAWSGGWMWIPRNPLAVEAGITEEVDAPLHYLRSEIGELADSPTILRFLEQGPEMVRFFRDHTEMAFIDGNKVPDFHAVPGAADGGRSVAAAPFDGRRLGKSLALLRPPLNVISLAGMGIASGQDIKHFFQATRTPTSAWYVTKRLLRHGYDLLRYRRSTQLVNGNALVARLFKSALDLGVRFAVSSRVVDISEPVEGGRQVSIQSASGTRCVTANKAVVFATGGFPHDSARQSDIFPAAAGQQHYSAAPKANTGDGIRLAERLGAVFNRAIKHPGAWSPVSLVPQHGQSSAHFPHLIERAKPGIIAVNRQGKRFVNEADSYHDFMTALFADSEAGQEPFCWLIADHRAQRRWGLGWSRPFPFPLGPFIRNGYLKRGETLEALAAQCELPSSDLVETVKRFNQQARQGSDPDFQRGLSSYNRVQGDPEHEPNPSLAALETAPYYAVKIVSGSLGTFAGLQTNENAQLLDQHGEVIPGLYAAGNDMSSIFGGHYPSGGITLGPAMTFGYIAARHIAAVVR